MPKTKIELEADLASAQTQINNLTVAAGTLTGERDTARAEMARLTGEVANRDTTITTITARAANLVVERDAALTGCANNRRQRNGLMTIAAILLGGMIGFGVWGFGSNSKASKSVNVAVLAEQAKSVAETGKAEAERKLADAETAKKTAEDAKVKAEAEKATAETAKAIAEQAKAETERKLTAAEAAQKAAEAALATAKATPPTPTQPVVATPVVPNGSPSVQVPDGEIMQLEKEEKKVGGLVCRYIPAKGGMINGQYVRPLFGDKEGRMVCQVAPGESVEDKIRNMSFDGFPSPDKSKIKVFRVVAYQGQIFQQLGLVE